ncbi:MAG: CDP-diacylglycerol--serine O-phosphatidyltransferase [Bacteroidia bacterium]|nr:CDP-diacylglycerol--serine O-phosphatidyltransferase [Bacteroidia bacterium]NNC86564.1 CDP-diacylglycerol--serine O-phosphatidyltransferase [Bacteroidia bacterium]NNM16031.1 CDP-diacylglycerol--serine O-phosphatidyltransferase [Bacteroidia bacterium]
MRRAIPNLFTSANLVCGVFAIIASFNNEIITAIELIMLSLIFDFIDGLAARALNAPSEFGKQLDSLADVISFGVAPACIMFNFIKGMQGDVSPEIFSFENIIQYSPVLIPLFAALRLAKFNIDENQKSSFSGLPSPAAGVFIISWPWIFYNSGSLAFLTEYTWFLALVCVVTSFMMVVPVEMFALKFKNTSWQDNKIRIVFLILSLGLLTLLFSSAVPIIILLYVFLSLMHIFNPSKTS